MKTPAERLQVLLPETITIACCVRGMVGRAIALNGQHESAWSLRMLRNEVDPISRSAPLRQELVATRCEGVADRLFEVVQRNRRSLATRQASSPIGGVLQVCAQ